MGRLETGKQVTRLFLKRIRMSKRSLELGCSQLELKCKTNCRPFEKNGPFSVPMGHEEMSLSIHVVCDPSNFSDQVTWYRQYDKARRRSSPCFRQLLWALLQTYSLFIFISLVLGLLTLYPTFIFCF